MAKRKVPSSKSNISKPKKLWPTEDSIELLAWIEHARIHHFSSRDTIVDHLHQFSGYPYTLAQIEYRLRYYRHWYRNPAPEFKKCQGRDAFNHGLSIFELLEPVSSLVKEAVTRLGDELLVTHLSSNRRLRSSSRLEERLSTPARVPFLGSQSPFSITQARSRSRQIEQGVEGFNGNFESRKRQKTEATTVSETTSLSERCSRADRSTSPTVDDTKIEDEVFSDEDGNSSRVVTPLVEQEGLIIEPKLNFPSSNISSLSKQQSQLKIDSAMFEVIELQRKLDEKEVRIQEYEEVNKELQKRVNKLRSIQHTRDSGGSEALEVRCERVEEQIRKQQFELQELKRLGAFTRLVSKPNMSDRTQWLGSTLMEESFIKINSEGRQVLRLHSSQRPFFIPKLAPHSELRRLVYKGLKLDSHVSLEVANLPIDLESISPKAITRAIITSALREWVFETDFPKVNEQPSELLNMYREILRNQDGPLVLRNLDLAAYDAMIKSENFRREIVPNKSKELAIRLSRTLAPFFSTCTEDTAVTDVIGFATWEHSRREYKERYGRFIEIFETALLAKADSILHSRQYSMVIYPPGSIFDKKTMHAETMEGAPLPKGRSYNGRIIELCVDAAVFCSPKKLLNENASVAEATMHSSTFGPMDGHNMDVKLLLPAVVVLRAEPTDVVHSSIEHDTDSTLSQLDGMDGEDLEWID